MTDQIARYKSIDAWQKSPKALKHGSREILLTHRSYTTYLEREVSKISTATKKGESCKKRKNKHEKERKMIIE
ncbi:hypothetical protein IGI04_031205 [Brassica rapa subsp. trilocularis]|uniref:Uncharacterized protein n=1 Tax=Brassica rapa subsp. trilocularis TaxID=1813537 RepID=A0ABQ7LSX9_BRACM|nr:hypothetical protein IGI04_031205 [Brassica rapa subsp. trilocularis]